MLKFTKILDPPEALKQFVWFIAVLEDSGKDDDSFNYDIVPLGDACIAFPIMGWTGKPGGPGILSFLLLSGPMSKLMRVLVKPKQVMVVRLKAGAFQSMFGAPAHLIKNKVVFLDKFWGAQGKAWAEALRKAPDTEARIQVLVDELLRRVPDFKEPDPYAAWAVDMMHESNGKLALEDLAARMGFTPRQVERKFEDGLGLMPKEYQRVLRCRLLILRMLNGDYRDWSELVGEYGYYDQAHLIREFKSFMGIAPEKFLRKFKSQGRVLESPLKGVRDETAFLGYDEGEAQDPRPPLDFLPIDVESVTKQSEELTDLGER